MHFEEVAYITNVIVLAGTWNIGWNLEQCMLGIVPFKAPKAGSNNTSPSSIMCHVQFGLWFFRAIERLQLPLK